MTNKINTEVKQFLKTEAIENKNMKIFKLHSKGWPKVEFEDLTIELLESKPGLFYITPNELFLQGQLFDVYSQSVFMTVYRALNDINKDKMRTIILKDVYKFANFLDAMWRWVK